MTLGFVFLFCLEISTCRENDSGDNKKKKGAENEEKVGILKNCFVDNFGSNSYPISQKQEGAV